MRSNTLSAVFYGWLVIFIVLLVSSFILSLLIKFTSFKDSNFTTVTVTISFITLFMGGLIAGLKNKEKGWLAGCLCGFGFSLIVFIIQYLGFHQAFSLEQITIHAAFILLATLGGILGVNLFTNKKI